MRFWRGLLWRYDFRRGRRVEWKTRFMGTIDADTRTATDAFSKMLIGRFPVAGAMLFGSRGRGSQRAASHAAVAVFLQGEPASFLETKDAMADVAFDVLLETGVLIKPLPVWETEWRHPERRPYPEFLAIIRREGVAL